jgi:hypothetical protein
MSPLWYFCSKCKNSFLVKGDDAEVHLLNKQMRCPNFHTCDGKIRQRVIHKNLPSGVVDKARWIKALHLYQASLGIGFPEERKCSPKHLTQLLVGSRIKTVNLDNAPDPKKSIILSISLDNGKVVHIGTSTKGAIIYKVTEESYGPY